MTTRVETIPLQDSKSEGGIFEKWPGLPQYYIDDGEYVAKSADFWLNLVQKDASCNPFVQWKPAYIAFCLEKGGQATKDHLNSVLTTVGVVAALVASFIIAGIQAPPECVDNGQECHINSDILIAYGCVASFGIITCLTTVVIVTIASTWIGLYEEQEMAYFLQRFYLATVMFPTTTMSFGSVSAMATAMLRIYMVFDPIVSYFAWGIMLIFGLGISHVATRLVLYSVQLRKSSTKAPAAVVRDGQAELVEALVEALKIHREAKSELKDFD